MRKWVQRFFGSGAASTQAAEPVDTSLSREQFAELAKWAERVAGGNSAAEAVLIEISKYYGSDWQKLLVILMDLDQKGIRAEKVVELFASCERDVELFRRAIA